MDAAWLEDEWLGFYLGRRFDSEGRTIEQIWAMNDRALERVHDYIQWLFPLRAPSPVNPDAPLMTDARANAMRTNAYLRGRLLTSFDRMVRFYGYTFRRGEGGEPQIEEASEDRPWVSPANHNYLRITRILACLCDAGLSAEARAFLGALEELYELEQSERGDKNRIGARSLAFWRSAVG